MFKKMNWKIGNSTLRNPKHILEAFIIFADLFTNRRYNAQFFIDNLNEHSNFSFKSKSNYIQANCIRAIFRELGLITTFDKKEVITLIGKKLLDNPSQFSNILIKQLSKMQFDNGKKEIKPFVVFTQFMDRLMREGIYTITKDEFNLFILTCLDNSDINNKINDLIRFRKVLERWGKNYHQKYKKLIIKEAIREIYSEEFTHKENILVNLLKDYNAVDLFYNHHLLDEVFYSKSRKSLSKKAKEYKKKIISNYYETNNIDNTVSIFTEYLCDIKRQNLLSDANITLNYLNETGLVSIDKQELSLNEYYKPVVSHVVNQNHLYINKDEYRKHHCFYTDIKLKNKVKQVQFMLSIANLLGKFRNQHIVLFLLALFTYNEDDESINLN